MRKLNSGLFIAMDGVVEAPHLWQFDVFDADMNKVISQDGTPIVYDRTGEGPALINVLGATATRAMVAQHGNVFRRCLPRHWLSFF